MRFLWYSFFVLLFGALLSLSDGIFGIAFLLILMFPPAGILMFLLTSVSTVIAAPLGTFLIGRALLRKIAPVRPYAELAAFGLCLFPFVGLPLVWNGQLWEQANRIQAEDFTNDALKSPGLALILPSLGHSLRCTAQCQAHLASHPEGLVTMLHETKPSPSLRLSGLTGNHASYRMVPKRTATCGYGRGQPRALLVHSATAELRTAESRGFCLSPAPAPGRADARLFTTQLEIPEANGSGTISVTRQTLLVRHGTNAIPAFQISSVFYEPFSTPLSPFRAKGTGYDLGLARDRRTVIAPNAALSQPLVRAAMEKAMP